MDKDIMERIVAIVDDHAGGIKMMDLLVYLLIDFCTITDVDILRVVRNTPHLGVLEYAMDLGYSRSRVKYFIYRKK